MVEAQPIYSLRGKSVWVAGHDGMVGSALLRRLQLEGCSLITAPREVLDLSASRTSRSGWPTWKPAGGVSCRGEGRRHRRQHDSSPADFLDDNLTIAPTSYTRQRRTGSRSSSFSAHPASIRNSPSNRSRKMQLLTGPLEPTNEWYAVAKIAGLMLCRAYRRQHGCDFIAAMPTNLYGPGDNFDLTTSHVIPALDAQGA